jgi:hypothetical protein
MTRVLPVTPEPEPMRCLEQPQRRKRAAAARLARHNDGKATAADKSQSAWENMEMGDFACPNMQLQLRE